MLEVQGVITEATGMTTFVASSLPPMPTSTTASVAARVAEVEERERR